jgi:hypothetical protein
MTRDLMCTSPGGYRDTITGRAPLLPRRSLLHEKREQARRQPTSRRRSTLTRPIPYPVRNGRTNVFFQITPLSTLQCPPGQRFVIESVDCSGLTLSGEGVSHTF